MRLPLLHLCGHDVNRMWIHLLVPVDPVKTMTNLSRCRCLQVGPWTRMKRKTVGGTQPQDIPAAQRANRDAAAAKVRVWRYLAPAYRLPTRWTYFCSV